MNIYQRINEVRKAVPYIRKDASVQNYRGITHDMVTAKLRDHLITHGVIVVPSLTDSSTVEFQTKNGGMMLRYEATYAVDFINMDEPSDKISLNVQAHANDTGDKAPGKCLSYAVKFAMLKLFSLETGENDESRVEVERKIQPISDEQIGQIKSLLEETESDEVAFCKWLKIDCVESLPVAAFDTAIAALKRKVKK